MTVTKDTPIAMLTVGQLQEALGIFPIQPLKPVKEEKIKQYVYGLAGIRKLFNVSHATAQRYKDTIISGAVSQQGRVIVTDVDKALQLFNDNKKRK